MVILSGGNVDAGLLAEVARRHESQAGRRLVLLARLPDRPGSLARLLTLVGERGANLLDVQHIREGIDLHVRETGVQLVLETRGQSHAAEVHGAVRGAGYAEPQPARAQTAAERYSRGHVDERADHAARLVGLGVPLDAEHEAAGRHLDRLGQVVEGRVTGDEEALAELIDPLVVMGLGPRGAPRPRRGRPASPRCRRTSCSEFSKLPGLRRCSSWPTRSGTC